MNRAWKAFRLACGCLTIVPVRFRTGEVSDADFAESRLAYPAVGLAVGLAFAAMSLALDRLGASRSVAAVVLVAGLAILTGGLHLDGLADTFDGLFLPGDRARRLAVLRDPHVGSFGVVALVLALLAKYAALQSLQGRDRALAILGACAIGRTLILIPAGLSRYARPEGTGRLIIDAATPREARGSIALVLLVALACAGWPGLVASLAPIGVALGLTRLANQRLGGVTGDILGALVELGELTFLVGVSIGR